MSASARPSPPPGPADRLPDRYRLRRHLATGGMAAVWCAEDRVLGRQVAIKVLSERYANDQLAVRRFKREARAAARVSAHPHVVTIYDVGDLEETAGRAAHAETAGAFIVMEHLAGGTVADALRHDAVAPADSRRWLREAAEALDHAHARGIVHRDIKPANFLLDNGRGLHVADFGIARLTTEDTISSTGELFGTAAYLAPEQALGHEATAASDRYALAVAAFELLTGARPFSADNFAAQARQHLEAAPPAASERNRALPSAVDPVLQRGMAKDPADRFPSSVAFVDALEAALDDRATAGDTAVTRRDTAVTRPLDSPLPIPVAPRAADADTIDRRAGGDRRATDRRPRRAEPLPAAAVGASMIHHAPRDTGRGRRGGLLALLALAVVAVGVVAMIAGLGSNASPRRTASISSHRTAPATRTVTHPTSSTSRSSGPAAKSSSTPSTTAQSTTAAPNPSPPATAPAASTPGQSASAANLQLLGYRLRLSGNYPAAIAADRRALAAADPSTLTYAYALYDLGLSLLRSGDPQAAIPYLQQRLKYDNQTATVQAALDQALREAGRSGPAATGGAHLPPGKTKKHDRFHAQDLRGD